MLLKAQNLQFLTVFYFSIQNFFSFLSADSIQDYCAKEICPSQGPHIRCNNDGKFSKNCTGDYKLEDMEPYIDLIIDQHNTYRNILAGGDLECFYPAVKMNLLKWDWDLAENAEFNARTCIFSHDKCRATSKHKYAGQNIYYARTKKLKTPIKAFIEEAIFLWFEEYKDADHKLMASVDTTNPQTGHFTVLMNDQQNRIGCACLNNLQNTLPPKRMIIFVCNYSMTNVRGHPAYKAGRPAAACQKRHSKFKYLCEDTIE